MAVERHRRIEVGDGGAFARERGIDPLGRCREVGTTKQELRGHARTKGRHRGGSFSFRQLEAWSGTNQSAERILGGGEAAAAESFVYLGLRGGEASGGKRIGVE